ncbi:MAG TPA: ATP-binding protein [Acidobacteriaceae bacterium]|nr:ATP-binding protein [Acidobacteriaceae bacterium]
MSRVLVIGDCAEVSLAIGAALRKAGITVEYAAGNADALVRLRNRSFGAVISCPDSPIAEDLALLEEMRRIQSCVKLIVLAPQSTPEEVIAALRARVFACFTPPFDPAEIADLAGEAASDGESRDDIQVASARPGWVTVHVSCRLTNADRLMTFAKNLAAQLPEAALQDMMHAFREILVNAMEHGAAFDPGKIVEVTAVRTARSFVFYVRDPGAGFRPDSLSHAAISNPSDDPAAHARLRDEQGMRPGGYGLLLASGTVDELIYSEIGNEVLLIKYTDSGLAANR